MNPQPSAEFPSEKRQANIKSIKNSKIITYAQKAAQTYQEESKREEILLDMQFLMLLEIDKYSLQF